MLNVPIGRMLSFRVSKIDRDEDASRHERFASDRKNYGVICYFVTAQRMLRIDCVQKQYHQEALAVIMQKFIRQIVLAIGIVSIFVLGYVILFKQSKPQHVDVSIPMQDARQQLESFLKDKMDYGQPFSQFLTEKRIDYARSVIEERPELDDYAKEVIDTLKSRLARKAKM